MLAALAPQVHSYTFRFAYPVRKTFADLEVVYVLLCWGANTVLLAGGVAGDLDAVGWEGTKNVRRGAWGLYAMGAGVKLLAIVESGEMWRWVVRRARRARGLEQRVRGEEEAGRREGVPLLEVGAPDGPCFSFTSPGTSLPFYTPSGPQRPMLILHPHRQRPSSTLVPFRLFPATPRYPLCPIFIPPPGLSLANGQSEQTDRHHPRAPPRRMYC